MLVLAYFAPMESLTRYSLYKTLWNSAFALVLSLGAAGTAFATPTQPLGYDEKGYPVWTEAQMALPELPPAALGATELDVRLKGYVFGLKMISADYDGWIGAERYALRSNLKTSGLGALLKKLRIWAVTEGRLDANGLYPETHVQQNRDKKRRRVEMAYDYSVDKVDVSVIPPNGSQGVPPASPTERFRADDTLSSLLSIMVQRSAHGKAACSGVVPVFDSKQHYNLRLSDRGVERDKIGDYRGMVRRCDIYYEPVSGFDPEDLPDVEEQSTPIKVWMGDIGGYDIPLKFSYKISGFKAVIKVDELTMRLPDGALIEMD